MNYLNTIAKDFVDNTPSFIEKLTETEIKEILKKNELFANALALNIL